MRARTGLPRRLAFSARRIQGSLHDGGCHDASGDWSSDGRRRDAAPLRCPNPNTYQTPRTLDPGKVQVNIAAEGIGVGYAGQSAVAPMLPSAGIRVGVTDGLDLGFREQNFDSLGADAKIRLVKGGFDLALDPGLQGFYASINGEGFGVVYLSLPVLLGFNVSRNVSIVASPGVVYDLVTATVNGGSGVTGSATASGFLGRMGVGVDFRVSKKLAIHPEVTVMQDFADSGTIVVFGLGFNIGAQPDYSDLGGDDSDGPSPPPPPAK
ncbi:MAG TPA: hypothetical protein VIJ22_20425 [Polyangiaceae bacterium]